MAAVDWSAYSEATTLREAFGWCGFVLGKTATPGSYAVHPRGKFNETLARGYPHQLYKWLHENYGCPCDPYWLN